MKSFKVLCVAMIAVFALAGLAAATASAASGPTLLFLRTTGEATILVTNQTLEPRNTVATSLGSAVITLTGKGDLLELTLLQTPSGVSGNYSVLFLEVEHEGQKCNSEGDRTGEVLLPLNHALGVYYSTSPLQAGILFEVAKFSFKCGTATVSTEGTVLGSLLEPRFASGTEISERTIFTGKVTCKEAGVPTKTEYTENGVVKNAELRVTAGGKTKPGCELIGAAETYEETFLIEKGSASSMFTPDF
jgi:hypothetical protein